MSLSIAVRSAAARVSVEHVPVEVRSGLRLGAGDRWVQLPGPEVLRTEDRVLVADGMVAHPPAWAFISKTNTTAARATHKAAPIHQRTVTRTGGNFIIPATHQPTSTTRLALGPVCSLCSRLEETHTPMYPSVRRCSRSTGTREWWPSLPSRTCRRNPTPEHPGALCPERPTNHIRKPQAEADAVVGHEVEISARVNVAAADGKAAGVSAMLALPIHR
jgi:hypothetical protein